MPTFGQKLLIKGMEGAARVMAAFGNEGAKQMVASEDARKAQLKVFDRVHTYALSKLISHEEAAREMGVAVPQELFDKFRLYDPVRGLEEYS